uniref:EGF-like domain-containing protein n=1 Tax=Periophthalmus magnuspinnatus TaxID=409849 RepID=A0A3B4AM32_9GOBI
MFRTSQRISRTGKSNVLFTRNTYCDADYLCGITKRLTFFIFLSYLPAVFPVLVVLFLFYTTGQTDASTDPIQTTASPAVTNSSLSTPLNSSDPMSMKSHRPCGIENVDFCVNGGQCFYYQNRDEPSCKCQFPYEGYRCLTPSLSRTSSGPEQLIAIIIGVLMVIFALVIIVYCCFLKRCVKSSPLKTSSPV